MGCWVHQLNLTSFLAFMKTPSITNIHFTFHSFHCIPYCLVLIFVMERLKDLHFYFSNFPDRISAANLRHQFSEFGSVVELFIPKKRNIAGNRFSFVRFVDVKKLHKLQKELNGLWFGSFKLRSHLALFSKPNVSSLRYSRVKNSHQVVHKRVVACKGFLQVFQKRDVASKGSIKEVLLGGASREEGSSIVFLSAVEGF